MFSDLYVLVGSFEITVIWKPQKVKRTNVMGIERQERRNISSGGLSKRFIELSIVEGLKGRIWGVGVFEQTSWLEV